MIARATALLFGLGVSLLGITQSDMKLVGTVTRIEPNGSRAPLGMANVVIPGIASDVTDDHGYFSLSLRTCEQCVVGTTLTVKVITKIGFAEKDYTIPINPVLEPCDISVKDNTLFVVVGTVSDKADGHLLSRVQVAASIPEYPMAIPSTSTDENGIFQLVLNRSLIESGSLISLTFRGAQHKDKVEKITTNQTVPLAIELEPTTPITQPTDSHVSGASRGTQQSTTAPTSTPCNGNTGTYCFHNNSAREIIAGFLLPGGPQPLTIRPGQTECYYEKPAGVYQYSITGKDSVGDRRMLGQGSARVEQCQTKTYEYP